MPPGRRSRSAQPAVRWGPGRRPRQGRSRRPWGGPASGAQAGARDGDGQAQAQLSKPEEINRGAGNFRNSLAGPWPRGTTRPHLQRHGPQAVQDIVLSSQTGRVTRTPVPADGGYNPHVGIRAPRRLAGVAQVTPYTSVHTTRGTSLLVQPLDFSALDRQKSCVPVSPFYGPGKILAHRFSVQQLDVHFLGYTIIDVFAASKKPHIKLTAVSAVSDRLDVR